MHETQERRSTTLGHSYVRLTMQVRTFSTTGKRAVADASIQRSAAERAPAYALGKLSHTSVFATTRHRPPCPSSLKNQPYACPLETRCA